MGHNTKGEFILEKFLKDYPESAGISSSQIESAISIVNSVFPSYDSRISFQQISLFSISNPSSFERYSYYRLLDKNLSNIDFSNARLGSLEEFCNKIEDWTKKGLRYELKTRFENIKFYNDKSDFEKVIKAIFYLARIPWTGDNDYSGFNVINLVNKIGDYSNSISSKFYSSKEEYRNFIISIFENAPSPYSFETLLLFERLKNIPYDFIIPIEKNEELRLKYFKQYLIANDKISMTTWDLFYYCNKINDRHSSQEQSSKIPHANELFIDYIKQNHLDDFICWIIFSGDPVRKIYGVIDTVNTMFDGYKNFKAFLLDFEISKYKYLKEFLEFFLIFEKNGFNAVEFSFNVIPIGNKQE